MDLLTLIKKSEAKILTVHPTLQPKAFELIKRAYKEGIYILITQGLRTKAQQDHLYSQGRSRPGRIVTNVRYPYSYHCWGLAIDFAVYKDQSCRVINWSVDRNWKRVGEIGESFGLEWGGRWTSFKDYPHFQLTHGLSINQLISGARIPDPIQPKKEAVTMEQVVASWAIEAQKWVKENGISDGTRPEDTVTRQEVWTMLLNLHKELNK